MEEDPNLETFIRLGRLLCAATDVYPRGASDDAPPASLYFLKAHARAMGMLQSLYFGCEVDRYGPAIGLLQRAVVELGFSMSVAIDDRFPTIVRNDWWHRVKLRPVGTPLPAWPPDGLDAEEVGTTPTEVDSLSITKLIELAGAAYERRGVPISRHQTLVYGYNRESLTGTHFSLEGLDAHQYSDKSLLNDRLTNAADAFLDMSQLLSIRGVLEQNEHEALVTAWEGSRAVPRATCMRAPAVTQPVGGELVEKLSGLDLPIAGPLTWLTVYAGALYRNTSLLRTMVYLGSIGQTVGFGSLVRAVWETFLVAEYVRVGQYPAIEVLIRDEWLRERRALGGEQPDWEPSSRLPGAGASIPTNKDRITPWPAGLQQRLAHLLPERTNDDVLLYIEDAHPVLQKLLSHISVHATYSASAQHMRAANDEPGLSNAKWVVLPVVESAESGVIERVCLWAAGHMVMNQAHILLETLGQSTQPIAELMPHWTEPDKLEI